MASFNIESLFTDIPLQETTDLCVENLFKDRTHVDNLSKDSFRERLKSVKKSTVSDHLLECNCSIDFNHFDILASYANKFRLIKESLLIKCDQPQFNKTIKSFPLKLFD